MTTEPTPGVFRFQVGDYACLSIRDDDASTYRVAQLYRTIPAGRVEHLLAEHQAPLQAESVLAAVLIDTPTHRILIDSGSGDLLVPEEAQTALAFTTQTEAAPPGGRLRQRLAQLGIAPESIDLVLLTHIHPDHVGGLLTAAGDLAYPSARVVCSEREVDFWAAPDLRQMDAPLVLKDLLVELSQAFLHRLAGQLTLIDPAPRQQVLPGIEALATPGHTPGHLAFRVSSAGQALCVVGDVLEHHVLSLARPDWPCDLDQQPAQASATARAILEHAATPGEMLAAAHFPWPSVGRVERAAPGYRWHPLPDEGVGRAAPWGPGVSLLRAARERTVQGLAARPSRQPGDQP